MCIAVLPSGATIPPPRTDMSPTIMAVATHARPDSPTKTSTHFRASASAVRAAIAAQFNERYALVRIATKVCVLDTTSSGNEPVLMQAKDFKLLTGNDLVLVPGTKNPVAKSAIWFTHEDRRTYDGGLTFLPGGPGEVETPSGRAWNLFRGWAMEPDPLAPEEAYRPFLDHVLDVVCGGDPRAGHWVLSFLADIIQRPEHKLGVALVLRGDEGCGKTTVAEVVGRLLGPHYAVIDKPDELTGVFNARLEKTLLLCADEAVWGGDKHAAGALKSLVTAPHLSIRRLYHDAVMQPNFTRVIFCSNENWVVPAGARARRFTVLDVPNTRTGDMAYFNRLWSGLESGGGRGFRGLLAYLQTYRIDYDLLRKPMHTDALTEQQLLGLPSHEAWWHEVLRAGVLPDHPNRMPNEAYKRDLRDAYLAHANEIGIRHRAAETQIGVMLKRLVPNLKSCTERPTIGMKPSKRPYWVLPSLSICRAQFDAAIGAKIPWEDPNSDWGGAP
jgi:hypothetical protein